MTSDIVKAIPYYTSVKIEPPQSMAYWKKQKQEAKEMLDFCMERACEDASYRDGIERYETKLDYLQTFTDAILIIDIIAFEVNRDIAKERQCND